MYRLWFASNLKQEGEIMNIIKMNQKNHVAAYCYGCGSQCQNRCRDQGLSVKTSAVAVAVKTVEASAVAAVRK